MRFQHVSLVVLCVIYGASDLLGQTTSILTTATSSESRVYVVGVLAGGAQFQDGSDTDIAAGNSVAIGDVNLTSADATVMADCESRVDFYPTEVSAASAFLTSLTSHYGSCGIQGVLPPNSSGLMCSTTSTWTFEILTAGTQNMDDPVVIVEGYIDLKNSGPASQCSITCPEMSINARAGSGMGGGVSVLAPDDFFGIDYDIFEFDETGIVVHFSAVVAPNTPITVTAATESDIGDEMTADFGLHRAERGMSNAVLGGIEAHIVEADTLP